MNKFELISILQLEGLDHLDFPQHACDMSLRAIVVSNINLACTIVLTCTKWLKISCLLQFQP